MATFRLSRFAAADLMDIGAYTLRTWGQEQAILYIDDLEACCRALADNPTSGRSCDHVRPGLRRMEQGKHVSFTGVIREAFLFPVSCTNACCRKDTSSAAKTKRDSTGCGQWGSTRLSTRFTTDRHAPPPARRPSTKDFICNVSGEPENRPAKKLTLA